MDWVIPVSTDSQTIAQTDLINEHYTVYRHQLWTIILVYNHLSLCFRLNVLHVHITSILLMTPTCTIPCELIPVVPPSHLHKKSSLQRSVALKRWISLWNQTAVLVLLFAPILGSIFLCFRPFQYSNDTSHSFETRSMIITPEPSAKISNFVFPSRHAFLGRCSVGYRQ